MEKTNEAFLTVIFTDFSNQRLIKEMEDRHRIDEIKFRKAGLGAIEKTYPYDPTKQRPKSE